MVTRHATRRQPRLIYPGVLRAIIRISLTVALTCCSGAMATAADDLYRAQAIVKPVDPDNPDVADVVADWKNTPGAVGIRIMLTKEIGRASCRERV